MNIEKINDLWLPSDDAQIEQWRKKGAPHMQDKCLKSFVQYCNSQNKKFKTVLDVGAWCGTWSKAIQPYCKRVIAFEPNKTTFECLQKNLNPFNHVTCNRLAIGDKLCNVSLTQESATQNTRVGKESSNIQDVQMFNIDYWNYDDVDMIKIDVEGYEMRVLEGANKTLTFNDENQSNVQYIMVELNNNTKKYGSSNLEIEEYIKNLGFKILIKTWPDIVYYRA
jgi:FkbM family methyltransferase|tara:strand:- start:79 stop:747 length:669 start_codon:yes stop_codon:yes gene_type:complete